MSDLISRSKLIEFIDRNKSRFGLTVANARNFMEIASMIPAEYDIDAVCEELEKREEEARSDWDVYDEESSFGAMNAYREAARIVRNGGNKN